MSVAWGGVGWAAGEVREACARELIQRRILPGPEVINRIPRNAKSHLHCYKTRFRGMLSRTCTVPLH